MFQGIMDIKIHDMTKWDELHTTDQMVYIEAIMTLMHLGDLGVMSDDEVMDKAMRMYACDAGYSVSGTEDDLWDGIL